MVKKEMANYGLSTLKKKKKMEPVLWSIKKMELDYRGLIKVISISWFNDMCF